MIGLLNAAYDTTHATTTWVFYHLAKYPAVQAKLLAEIDGKLGSALPTRENTLEGNCPYLHAVLQESTRMVATVPVNQRVNLDNDVKIGKKIVPKGCNINIPMFVMFKNEKYLYPPPPPRPPNPPFFAFKPPIGYSQIPFIP